MPEDQFRFVSNQDGSIVGLAQIASHQTLEYSLEGNTWHNLTTETTISLSKNVVLYVRGKLTNNNTIDDFTQFTLTGSIEAKGNINYIWDYENLDAPLKKFCGRKLFSECKGLTNISQLQLPSTTLANECYRNMFAACVSLQDISNLQLPATSLAKACYFNMFLGCHNINSLPQLIATNLASQCYRGMFAECDGLTNISGFVLPAKELADSCYMNMFSRCTNLTTACALPATKLANACYLAMFNDNPNLVNVPALPATTLTEKCYRSMFRNCTNLTTAPELPSTNLAEDCYREMFLGCSSLTIAPELSALTLTENCYRGMFQGCSALETAPALPALILVDSCYRSMFYNCTSLAIAPVLPAKTLTNQCYYAMFQLCSKLNYIKCLATNISASSCTQNWVQGVAASGTFIKDVNMNDWATSTSGIPSGWTTQSVTVYTITWLQDDGSLIDKTMVDAGQIPTHVIPTKEPTAEYIYTFVKWAPEVVAATENATYIAIYETHPIPTALDDVNADARATKILRNGQVFILRGNKTYTVTGLEVR